MKPTDSNSPNTMATSGNGAHTALRTPWILFVGAMIGLALATIGLLEERSERRVLPEQAAAIVGDRTIRRVDYQRVLAGVESDLRNPVDDALRRRVLDRMIDEELLVQRALDLGLAVVDRRVRGELTSGLIDSIVSEADANEPTPSEIESHYEENINFFTRPGRLRVQTLFFADRSGDDRANKTDRALEAERRLRELDPTDTEGIDQISSELATPQISKVPNTLLPPGKLRDYVGPTLLVALEPLSVGEWSPPIESGSGLALARVIEREPPIVPALADIESIVRQDLKRRRGDEGLRRYLDDLRSETEVRINDSVF